MNTIVETNKTLPAYTLFGETEAFPDIVHCERFYARARHHEWTITPHRHAHMVQIFIMQEGFAAVRVADSQMSLENGQFLYVPANEVHGFSFRQGSEGLVLSIPISVVLDLQPSRDELLGALGRSRIGPCDENFMALAKQFDAVFSSDGIFRAQKLTSLSHLLLATIAEQNEIERGDSVTESPHMVRFAQLISAHIGDNMKASDYAQRLGITTGHLNRICRSDAGLSATRFIDVAVMAEACRLLAFTRLAVAEVGYRLGFQDPSYFARRFQSLRGETPSSYRQRFQQ